MCLAGVGDLPSALMAEVCHEARGAPTVIMLTLQPPIAVFGTPGRYASALYSAASKAKTLPTAQKELAEVLAASMLTADRQLLCMVLEAA